MSSAPPLPPEHPAFAAHFRNAIYRAEDPEAYDLPPFGTDTGSDVLDRVINHPDLSSGIKLSDLVGLRLGATDGLTDDPNEDDDSWVIANGFALLRCTGRIDPQGRQALTAALIRQLSESGAEPEYETMLSDLETFNALSTPGPRAPKRTKSWLVLQGGWNDPPHAHWLKSISRAVRQDPQWQSWWSTSPVEQLVLAPRPMGGAISLEAQGGVLEVVGGSATLSRELTHYSGLDDNPRWDRGVHAVSPKTEKLFLDLIVDMAQAAATHLGLPKPPALPTIRTER